MKKNLYRKKLNLINTFVLSVVLTVGTVTTAFAAPNDVQSYMVTTVKSDIQEKLFEKQKEIDEYIFEKNAKEIEKKGFTVTHTGAVENYVEVGIAPYNEENAEYLYEIFGKDNVKVVEGQQAILLNEVAEARTIAATAENVTQVEEPKANLFTNIISGFASFAKFLTNLI